MSKGFSVQVEIACEGRGVVMLMSAFGPITLSAGAPAPSAGLPAGVAVPVEFSSRPLRLSPGDVTAAQESFGVLIASSSMTRSIATESDFIVVLRFDADESIHAAVLPWSRLALRTGAAHACVQLPTWTWALVADDPPPAGDVRNASLRQYLVASGIPVAGPDTDLVPAAAIRALQERRGMPATGVLDAPTGRAIVRDLASQSLAARR